MKRLEKEIDQLRTEIRELRRVVNMLLEMMGEEEELNYHDTREDENSSIYA